MLDLVAEREEAEAARGLDVGGHDGAAAVGAAPWRLARGQLRLLLAAQEAKAHFRRRRPPCCGGAGAAAAALAMNLKEDGVRKRDLTECCCSDLTCRARRSRRGNLLGRWGVRPCFFPRAQTRRDILGRKIVLRPLCSYDLFI